MWFNAISLFFVLVICSYLYPSVCSITDTLFESSKQVVSRSVILRPNADGDETALLQNNQATNNYKNVDDIIADGNTTALRGGLNTNDVITYTRDLYNIENSSLDNEITSISIYVNCKYNINSGNAKIVYKTSNTTTESSEIVLSNTYTLYNETFIKNPITNDYWTWNDINALQIGVALKGNLTYNYANCTQVFAEVRYMDEAAMSSQTALGWKIMPIGIIGVVLWGLILYVKNQVSKNNQNN